ncbi:MAG: hypothetical protein QW407_03285, partial [Thermofilaceae archaeon]
MGKLLWVVVALLTIAPALALVKADEGCPPIQPGTPMKLYTSASYDSNYIVEDTTGEGRRYQWSYEGWSGNTKNGTFASGYYWLVGNGWHYFRAYAAYCSNSNDCRVEGSASFRSYHSYCVGTYSGGRPQVLREEALEVDYTFNGVVKGMYILDDMIAGLGGKQLAMCLDLTRIQQADWESVGAFVHWASVDMMVYYLKVEYKVTGETFTYNPSGTSPPPSPPPSYTLTIQVLRATASGATSAPANGTRVRIGGTEYTADSNGRVQVTLQQGSYSVEILETYYGPTLTAGGLTTNWRRYRFWKWSDESTDNPRSVSLSSNTNLTAYVWDERALLVRWEPHFDGDAWGVLNATSGARLGYDSIVWLKRGQTVQLLSVEGSGMIFTYWRVGTECYRGQPYSSDPLLTLTMGDRGLSAIAVFRLAATNQTMLPPGAGMVNPVTYIPGATMGGEERMGKKGWWLLTVTHVPTGKTSPAEAGIDGRAWIYALIVHGNGSSRWVPVTGVWRLHLAQDWSQTLSRHVKDLPGGVKIIEWDQSTVSDFPKIQDPQEWRDWRFVTLSAWDPLVYEELGRSYDTSGLWLANGSTLALYNVTFAYMGVNGDRVEYVYWQPIAVSTLTFRAEARYTLTSHEASLGRRRILMSIYVNATWKYVPPQYWQLLGFRVHAPQLGYLASLEEPGCTGTFCIGYWAPPSQAGSSWRLYVISLGDTEDFYSKAYPRGLLGGDGYNSVREFRISMRWMGAGNHPSTLIWGSDRVTFKLAPASVYKLEWTDPRGPFTVTWGCFAQGPWGLTPISSYTADLTFDWGVLGTNRSCANPARFNGVTSPYTVNVQVPADNWIAFYVIPAG